MKRGRKVVKAARPSRSIASVKSKAKSESWEAMLTFNPPDSNNEKRSNAHQRYLVGLLRRELKGKFVAFLLVREFGTGRTKNERPDASHFHVVLAKDIPRDTVERIKRAFLRRCQLPDNRTKAFHYQKHTIEGESRFGNYVSKIEKGKIDVFHPPISWNPKRLVRAYHFGYYQ